MNRAYAARFPRRSKQARRKARRRRVLQREAAWLALMGITSDRH